MKSKFFIVGFALAAWNAVSAQGITFNKDIAPIVFQNCSGCHRPGEVGPMPLTNYAEVSAWGGMVKYVTANKIMPPWRPDPHYSRFADERRLTDKEIELIGRWVDDDMPEGDPAHLPPFPDFPTGSPLGEPDVVYTIPAFTVPNNGDVYHRVTIPSGFTSDKWINGVELVPDNRAIVHHMLLYVGQYMQNMIGGWVPGQRDRFLPNNMAYKVPAGSNLILEIHYAPGSMGQVDQSQIKFHFSPNQINPRQVFIQPYINWITGLQNGPLRLQPGEVKTFNNSFNLSNNISVLGLSPHMHLIGRSMKVFSVHGSDTIRLIDVPDWNFAWQGFYTPQKLIKIPSGSAIKAISTYDNTSNNPFNPSSPPQLVNAGESTYDEMLLCYFTFVNYQAGDENIWLTDTTQNALTVYPGDADNDGNVTPSDFFLTAAGYGKAGPVRAPLHQSTVFRAQKASYWPSATLYRGTSLNDAFLDANGDGALNLFDVAVTVMHRGQSRP